MTSTKKLPKCDCLNYCGDDPWLEKGKAEYCCHFKDRAKAAALVEIIRWNLPDDAMPANDVLVLGFFDDQNEGEPVWPCLHSGGRWLIADGMPTDSPKAWAPMPQGPKNTHWMTVRSKTEGRAV